MKSLWRLALLFALAPALQGCSKGTAIKNAWRRLPAVAGRPAAAYFDIEVGTGDLRLVAVKGPFERAELHETMEAHGVAAMRPMPYLELHSQSEVSFEPGGKHAMLFGLEPRLRPGGRAELRFAEGNSEGRAIGEIAVEARVVGPADPTPYPKGLFRLW